MQSFTIEAAAGGAVRPGEGSCGGTFVHRKSKLMPHEVQADFGQTYNDWGPTADWGGIDPSAEFMRMLPKAELHCHLDGSVRPSTILALAQEQGLTKTAKGEPIPTTLEGVEKVCRIGLDCKDLGEYLSTFDLTCSVLQTPASLTRAVVEIAEDAAADGVIYLELRFSPLLHRAGGMTMTQVLTSVLKGRELAELQLHVRIGFILCGIRTMPESEVVLLSELAWRYRERGTSSFYSSSSFYSVTFVVFISAAIFFLKRFSLTFGLRLADSPSPHRPPHDSLGVVGFDLAGAEALGKAAAFESAFAHVTAHQLNVTIHAGEADDWTSVHDAVQVRIVIYTPQSVTVVLLFHRSLSLSLYYVSVLRCPAHRARLQHDPETQPVPARCTPPSGR
jgi:adenosine deaminase